MGKWEMVKLGDVCEILDSQRIPVTASERKAGNYPYFGANGVQGYVRDYIFDDELVLLAEDGGNFGSKTRPIAYRVSGKCWVNNHAHVLRAKQCLDTDYLCKSIMFYDVSKLISGTTRAKLNQAAMRKMLIPLPSLDEQKRIAKNLDLASEIVKGYNEQLAELDKLVQSVFYEMFGDPVTNEKGWETTNLGRCIELLSDFSANGAYEYLDSHVKMYDEPNYALMIRTTDLEKNDFTNGVKYIDENAYKILEKSKVFGNEIIMSKIGSAGKIYLMPKLDMPVSLGRNAFLIRLKQNADVIFLYNLLSTSYGKTEIMQYVRGAVTKTITKDSVRAIRIVLPPLELQTHFASIVTEIETQKAQVQQALTEAENFYNSLMQEYFE